jgi:hypothetical protein
VPKNIILSSFVHASTIHTASLAKKTTSCIGGPLVSPVLHATVTEHQKKGLTRKELRRSIRRAELLDFFWELFLVVGLMEDDVLEHVSPYLLGRGLQIIE